MEGAGKQINEAGNGNALRRVWAFCTVCLFISAVILGLALVWLNLERVDLGYKHKARLDLLAERRSMGEKLEVEKERLLSPQILMQKARAMGKNDARPGQVRRMENNW